MSSPRSLLHINSSLSPRKRHFSFSSPRSRTSSVASARNNGGPPASPGPSSPRSTSARTSHLLRSPSALSTKSNASHTATSAIIDRLKIELEEANNRAKRERQKNQKLQQQLSETEDNSASTGHMEQIMNERNEFERKYKQCMTSMAKEKHNYETKLRALKQTCEMSDSKFRTQTTKIESLKRQLNEKDKRITSLLSKNADLTDQLESVQDEFQTFVESAKAAESETKLRWQDDVSSLEVEGDVMLAKLQQYESKVKLLRKENKSLHEEVHELKKCPTTTQYNKLSERYKNLGDRVIKAEQLASSTVNQLGRSRKKCDSLKLQLERSLLQVRELYNANGRAIQVLKDEKRKVLALIAERTELESQNQDLTNQVSKLEDELDCFGAEFEPLLMRHVESIHRVKSLFKGKLENEYEARRVLESEIQGVMKSMKFCREEDWKSEKLLLSLHHRVENCIQRSI